MKKFIKWLNNEIEEDWKKSEQEDELEVEKENSSKFRQFLGKIGFVLSSIYFLFGILAVIGCLFFARDELFLLLLMILGGGIFWFIIKLFKYLGFNKYLNIFPIDLTKKDED